MKIADFSHGIPSRLKPLLKNSRYYNHTELQPSYASAGGRNFAQPEIQTARVVQEKNKCRGHQQGETGDRKLAASGMLAFLPTRKVHFRLKK